MQSQVSQEAFITNEVAVGDRVRAYDFESNKECYYEGIVKAIVQREDCPRYEIKTTLHAWNGKITEHPYTKTIFPPVNGTRTSLGHICNFVEKL